MKKKPNSVEPNPLAVYIRKRRRALDLTQLELSNRLKSVNVDRSAVAISNWETGRQPVPYGMIPALAAVLEEPSVEYMFSLTGIHEAFTRDDLVEIFNGLTADEINQLLHAYFGKYRIAVEAGKVAGLAVSTLTTGARRDG